MKTKKQISVISIALLLAALSSNVMAQSNIALHSNGTVTHYAGATALDMAYTAARPMGDTLYLPGGIFTPPAVFDKGLTIFGAGFHPDSTTTIGQTIIAGDITLKTNADNFHIEGVEITGHIYLGNFNDNIDNVSIIRCKMNSNISSNSNRGGHHQNTFIIGSVVVGSADFRNCQSLFLYNSIFQNVVNTISHGTIKNCLFLLNNNFVYHVLGASSSTIENNVFVKNHSPGGHHLFSGTNNRIYNNISGYANFPYGTGAIQGNNYPGVNRDSMFVDQIGNAYNYAHDYHIKHPQYVGRDGSPVGIYGGTFPWKEGAVPSNPHIRSNNTANQTNDQGLLQIDIEVSAQGNVDK